MCIDRFGWTFCPGDKVTQIENDYDEDVYNGDLGVVSRIDMEEGEISVDFDGREVTGRHTTGHHAARADQRVITDGNARQG